VTIKDDSGKDCYIEDIRIFQKHLNEFNKKDLVFRWNDAVFSVDDSLRKKVDELVKKSLSESSFIVTLNKSFISNPLDLN
jgi:hypothetical protein